MYIRSVNSYGVRMRCLSFIKSWETERPAQRIAYPDVGYNVALEGTEIAYLQCVVDALTCAEILHRKHFRGYLKCHPSRFSHHSKWLQNLIIGKRSFLRGPQYFKITLLQLSLNAT